MNDSGRATKSEIVRALRRLGVRDPESHADRALGLQRAPVQVASKVASKPMATARDVIAASAGIDITEGSPGSIVALRQESSNGALAFLSRTPDCSMRLVLSVAPRTKKGHTTLGIVQSAAYRRYRDEIIAALSPITFFYGRPLLPDREYNCAAKFYVDKPGEQADFNGLNQGLHDALENAGVVSDDWFFRSCDGTRILFGSDRPRVDVLITPAQQPPPVEEAPQTSNREEKPK